MVSHSLNSLKEYCDVVIYIKSFNEVKYYSVVTDALAEYIIDTKIQV